MVLRGLYPPHVRTLYCYVLVATISRSITKLIEMFLQRSFEFAHGPQYNGKRYPASLDVIKKPIEEDFRLRGDILYRDGLFRFEIDVLVRDEMG